MELTDTETRDPRHVFLSASDVLHRYGWGKTRGYQNLKDPEQVPPPVVRRPMRWRLDQLMAWEDRKLAMAGAELDASASSSREPMNLADLLPQPKQRRRSA